MKLELLLFTTGLVLAVVIKRKKQKKKSKKSNTTMITTGFISEKLQDMMFQKKKNKDGQYVKPAK